LALNVIIQNEINDISALLGCTNENVPLSDLMAKEGRNFSSNPDKRTFIAHAGLPAAFVEVNCDTKGLRYKRDVMQTIKSYLS